MPERTVAAKHPVPPLAIRAWLRYDVVSRAIDRLAPRTILEIGCGQGAFGGRLAGRFEYLGVEPDQTSYQVAAARIEPLGGTVLNARHDALAPGTTFDVVCAFEVLEHIEDDTAALASWVPFIRPGGHLMLSVPAFQDRFGPMDIHAGHFRRYSPEEMRDRLTAAGLVVDEITVYGWPLGYALEAVRNGLEGKRQSNAAGRDTSIDLQTAGSGRYMQPTKRTSGLAIQAVTLPFRYLQRASTHRGTGLVAIATRPTT